MLSFYKYQGAGNDFILLDERDDSFTLSKDDIAFLCDRRRGVGADGLMLLQNDEKHHFRMVYFNADGNESSMCGNGGRCICLFAKHLGLVDTDADFVAIDGTHRASFLPDGKIALEMNNVFEITHDDNYAILNTGSPHYVAWTDNVCDTDVVAQGREIRNRERFAPGGINVNFAERAANGLFVRTYERGVEDETLSCGTGVTAAAIASTGEQTGKFNIAVETKGGTLSVAFEKPETNAAINVVLTGPALFVFKGSIDLS